MSAILGDFTAGFIVGQATTVVIGLWSITLGLLTGTLWVMGGRGFLGTNLWRRAGVSMVVSLTFALAKHSFIPMMSFPLMWLAMSVGYGTPSTQPPDEGSWLGRIFGEWARFLWFLILALTMIPLFL